MGSSGVLPQRRPYTKKLGQSRAALAGRRPLRPPGFVLQSRHPPAGVAALHIPDAHSRSPMGAMHREWPLPPQRPWRRRTWPIRRLFKAALRTPRPQPQSPSHRPRTRLAGPIQGQPAGGQAGWGPGCEGIHGNVGIDGCGLGFYFMARGCPCRTAKALMPFVFRLWPHVSLFLFLLSRRGTGCACQGCCGTCTHDWTTHCPPLPLFRFARAVRAPFTGVEFEGSSYLSFSLLPWFAVVRHGAPWPP